MKRNNEKKTIKFSDELSKVLFEEYMNLFKENEF